MTGLSRTEELVPSARRLITSLRDIGYDFTTAVADIVDNSVEARAHNVWIEVKFEGRDSWVSIADDGCGMSSDTLLSAMRYGSEKDYSEDALGKFGLGLKTASLSQCRRLTVASRNRVRKPDIAIRCWDLEHISNTDAWEVLALAQREFPPDLLQHLKRSTGTVVLWKQLDRILEYKNPEGPVAWKRLLQMCRDLEAYLSMVFHRFLSGEVPGRELDIFINGNKMDPRDPFARSEKNTKVLNPWQVRIEHAEYTGIVTVQPYILPPQSKFSSTQAFNNAAGPEKWNKQQGFYIYRANRMIQSGGWSGLRTLDEHTKLVRLSLSFSPALEIKHSWGSFMGRFFQSARFDAATVHLLRMFAIVETTNSFCDRNAVFLASRHATSISGYMHREFNFLVYAELLDSQTQSL